MNLEAVINALIYVAVSCAALIVILILAMLIHYKRARVIANRLLNEAERDSSFVYSLLKTAFPSSHILFHTYLTSESGERVPTDMILVDHGGIFVFKIKTFPGMIDNTSRQKWTVSNYKGVGTFDNPFEQNRACIDAVNSIVNNANVYDVPTHNVVVFAAKKVSFKIRSENLVTADKLLSTVKDMNRNRFLSSREISAVLNALKKSQTRK